MVCAPFVLSGEAKIDELHVLVLIKKDILQLEIAMDARLFVYVGHSSDKLSKDLLDLRSGKGSMCEEVVV